MQSVTEYYRVLQSVTECYRVLQSVTEYYRVLQSITEYYRVLQNITEYYRVFLAHLLGPLFGLVLLLFANLFFRSIRSNLDVQWVWQAGEEEENHCEGGTTQQNIHKIILISASTFSHLSISILSTNSILIFVLILTRKDKLLKLEILVANNANIRVYIFILNFFCKGQHPGACFQ